MRRLPVRICCRGADLLAMEIDRAAGKKARKNGETACSAVQTTFPTLGIAGAPEPGCHECSKNTQYEKDPGLKKEEGEPVRTACFRRLVIHSVIVLFKLMDRDDRSVVTSCQPYDSVC